MRIIALIPAAGFSSRMGAFKPLLPLGLSTVIEEAAGRFRLAGIEDIRVVTGHRAGELTAVLEKLGIEEIANPEYASGMFSSILAGLKSMGPEVEAFFLLPVDIPLIKPGTINIIAQAYSGSGAGIIYPRFEGVRGHPTLISRRLVANLPEDCEGGLRAFLAQFEEQAFDVDVTDQSVLMDCDTQLDYLKLKAYSSREYVPTERECRELLRVQGASKELTAHSMMVAEVALTLAAGLKCAGFALNPDLIAAAGWLHDLAKGRPDHAAAGAEFLEKLGHDRVARIVGLHTDLGMKRKCLDESDLVYLADKLFKGDLPVSLEKRFDGPLKKFADRPEVLTGVTRRLADARALKACIEKALGISVYDVVHECVKRIRAACAGSPRNIYLARHCSVRHPGDVKRFIGHTDLPLSADGIAQAGKLAEKLRHTPLSAIYCSDLQRSVETACIIAEHHETEPVAISGLREIGLGEWDGLPVDEVRMRHPVEYEKRGKDLENYRTPGGESFLDCACRVMPALDEIIKETQGDILIVGHAGMNRVLLCRILGKPLNEMFEIPQDYGCLNLIGCRSASLELETLNEVVQSCDFM
jgi:molybdenum cofactor cytidylyltransferase